MTFFPVNSVLVLAPHLRVPSLNGGDVYIAGLYRYLATQCKRLVVVTSREIIYYAFGLEVASTSYQSSRRRSKALAGARTVIFSSHYLTEAFITSRFKKTVSSMLDSYKFDAVICSYLSTSYSCLQLLPPSHLCPNLFVITQNDEFTWFANMNSKPYSWLVRIAAMSTLKWLHRHTSSIAKRSTFVHICQSDADGWDKHIPQHSFILLPPGIDPPQQTANPVPPDTSITLLFAGSLSAQMNIDCLHYFAHVFYPHLSAAFSGKLFVRIVGSNPSQSIVNLARNNQWVLCPNLSNEAMELEYLTASFSILPFSYSNGTKLKLLKSLSYGVPVLATSAVLDTGASLPLPNLVSDSPTDWVNHLHAFKSAGINLTERLSILELVKNMSWDLCAKELIDNILLPH